MRSTIRLSKILAIFYKRFASEMLSLLVSCEITTLGTLIATSDLVILVLLLSFASITATVFLLAKMVYSV